MSAMHETRSDQVINWWESYSCGCVSEMVQRRHDLPGHCSKHGVDRDHVHHDVAAGLRPVPPLPSPPPAPTQSEISEALAYFRSPGWTTANAPGGVALLRIVALAENWLAEHWIRAVEQPAPPDPPAYPRCGSTDPARTNTWPCLHQWHARFREE